MSTQITLELNQTESKESVDAIFDALSQEDMVALAKDLLRQWFETPPQAEREVFLGEKLREIIKGDGYYKSEQEAKRSYAYQRALASFVSSKEKASKAVFERLAASVESQIDRYVQDSEYCQRVIKSITDALLEKSQEYFLAAMRRAVAASLQGQILNVVNDDLVGLKSQVTGIVMDVLDNQQTR